ncbi:hypothetical protein ILUMI_20696, partial [Ignelater luminosus]
GRHKMKVKYATQVFSRSVHAELQFASLCNVMKAQDTVEVVTAIDKLFSSLNGVRNSARPLNGPITDKSGHFEFWEEINPFLFVIKKQDRRRHLHQ